MAPGRRLLILEDDVAVANVMRAIARSCHFDIRHSDDPADVFHQVSHWKPTHIALDLVLPDMDGVQVLGHLATLNCRAKLIISSGMGSRVLEAAQRSAAEHGLHMAGILAKPFDAAALRALLLDGSDHSLTGKPATRAAADEFESSVHELRRCLERDELRLVYQPKVECATNALAGFEALARWQHPLHGTLAPDKFIPFAERHGLVDALTEKIVDLALGWIAARSAVPGPSGAHRPSEAGPLTLSLNLSAASLRLQDLVERLTDRCRHFAVPPSQVVLELTETSAMEDPVASLDILTRLRMKGFQLSLDDFGTGYSSIVQLVRMPFSEIKVDKSFVMSAMHSNESRIVVSSIVDLAKSLSLKSAAEGVEDAQTMAFLRQIGCDLAQGYWISPGLPGEQVDEWIAKRERAAGGRAPSTQATFGFPGEAP